jgi:hypothetical protein
MNSDVTVTATFTRPCAYTILPASKSFVYAGGAASVTVTATGGQNCLDPVVAASDTWIGATLTSFTNNKGSVKVTVLANTAPSARNGTATIGGQTFRITQAKLPYYSLNANIHGDGTVTATGLICKGKSCSGSYPSNAAVTLTAQADTYSTFTGWSGGGCSGAGSCVVTITANKTVNAIFTSDPPILTSPNGGEVLSSGSPTTVTWTAPPTMTKFKLFYSLDGGSTWVAKPTTYVTGNNWSWTPRAGWNKNNCRFMVKGFNAANTLVGADRSDGPFAIEVLKVTAPNGGETCISGQVCPIAWTHNATIAPPVTAQLSLSRDGGTTWSPIATVSGTKTTYDWKPTVLTSRTACRVRVTLLDALGNNIGSDKSDGNFTISGP